MNAQAQSQPRNNDEPPYYSLILFVVPSGSNSIRARENLERLCEQYLPGRHEIRIVDVLQDFQTALDHNILLTPSVVVTAPAPRVTIHGDLSDTHQFIRALKLPEEDGHDN